MKKQKKVSDYFNGIEDLFNPGLIYEGSFAIPGYIFTNNSKIVNGSNLTEEYFDKTLYDPIKKALSKLNLVNNPNLFLISDVNPDGYGRSLKPSLSFLIMDLCREITGKTIDFSEDNTELRQQVRDFSRWFRKELSAIERGEMNEERQELLSLLKNDYAVNEKLRLKYEGPLAGPLSFNTFLARKKESMVSLSFATDTLISIFSKPISLSELGKCLDLDKFYLTMMKFLIETTDLTIEIAGTVHNSLIHLTHYIDVIEDIRKKSHYNLTIDYPAITGKVIKYSVDDLIREYNEIRLKNPKYEIISISDEPDCDLRNLEQANEYKARVEDVLASKKLQASWNFINNGTRLEESPERAAENQEIKKRLSSVKKRNYRKSRDELIQSTCDRIAFLDSTPYVYKMNGKNNFDGYVGYIYENGSVIFEKFYRSLKSHEPAEENATYVMSFNNFVDMSRKTKTEIMRFIKNGATDLRRVYHTSTWCDRILQIINGRTYNQEAMDRIERLINEGQILKKN